MTATSPPRRASIGARSRSHPQSDSCSTPSCPGTRCPASRSCAGSSADACAPAALLCLARRLGRAAVARAAGAQDEAAGFKLGLARGALGLAEPELRSDGLHVEHLLLSHRPRGDSDVRQGQRMAGGRAQDVAWEGVPHLQQLARGQNSVGKKPRKCPIPARVRRYGHRMPTSKLHPEQQARERIDAMLREAGWTIQDYNEADFSAAPGVAVREFVTPEGPLDYLLVADRKVVARWRPRPRVTRCAASRTRRSATTVGSRRSSGSATSRPTSMSCRTSTSRRAPRRCSPAGATPSAVAARSSTSALLDDLVVLRRPAKGQPLRYETPSRGGPFAPVFVRHDARAYVNWLGERTGRAAALDLIDELLAEAAYDLARLVGEAER